MKQKDLLDQLQSDWQSERPDLDSSGMGIVGRIVLLGEYMKKNANEVLEPLGIGYTDLDVLATLRRSGSPYTLRPADLLKAILIQSGSLTACLDRLERSSLIKRVPTPNDRRSRSVKLTKKGKTLIDEAIETRFKEAKEAVQDLTKTEQKTLESLLRKLLLTTSETNE